MTKFLMHKFQICLNFRVENLFRSEMYYLDSQKERSEVNHKHLIFVYFY